MSCQEEIYPGQVFFPHFLRRTNGRKETGCIDGVVRRWCTAHACNHTAKNDQFASPRTLGYKAISVGDEGFHQRQTNKLPRKRPLRLWSTILIPLLLAVRDGDDPHVNVLMTSAR